MNFRQYTKYVISGVPWLEMVPEHWDIRRGKWLFQHKKEINSNLQYTNILSLTLRGVVNNDPNDPEGLVPKDYATYQFFKKGDLVFKLIDLENIRTSRVGLVHEDGIMSSAYVRLVSKHKGNQRFFYLQFYDLYQRNIFNQLGAGVRSTLGPKDLLDINILVPNISEQTAIVRFLDYMDRKIKKYIRAKQKQIKLLEEQKQTIINDAVTGKIDVRTGKPYPKYKDSGVEWLGMVPEHWEVRRLKFLINGKLKYGANSAGVEYSESLPRYIRITDFDSNGNFRSDTKLSLNADIAEDYLLNEGDILFARSGATVGKSFQCKGLKERSCFAGYLIKAVPNDSIITSDYLYLYAQSNVFLNWKNYSFIKATIENIGADKYSRLFVLLPSLDEQKMIELWKIKQTENLYLAIAHNERGIEFMREYRTRLIADVVTGKLDVREATEKIAGIASVEDELTTDPIEELSEEIKDDNDSQENQDVIKEEE